MFPYSPPPSPPLLKTPNIIFLQPFFPPPFFHQGQEKSIFPFLSSPPAKRVAKNCSFEWWFGACFFPFSPPFSISLFLLPPSPFPFPRIPTGVIPGESASFPPLFYSPYRKVALFFFFFFVESKPPCPPEGLFLPSLARRISFFFCNPRMAGLV